MDNKKQPQATKSSTTNQATNKEEQPGSRLMPVDRLNYSSFTQLLRNPLMFKLTAVLGVYDPLHSVSAMIGKAAHEALEVYYGGNEDVPCPTDPIEARAYVTQYGLDIIETTEDNFIDYKKTGTREEILKGYTAVMNYYWQEEPVYNEILACEQKMTAEIKTAKGELLPLPASGKPDLVVKNGKGEVEIIDHKFKKIFTPYDEEDYVKIMQAMFMYHLVKETLKVTPVRMIFRETKRTKNKDGSPQMRDWVIPYDERSYFIMYYNLYKDIVRFLSPTCKNCSHHNDPIFLPNLSDPFDGKHAGMMYAQGLIDADMSDVEVMHKVKDVARVSKKFVASNLDRAENKHLPPEERIKMRLAEFGIPLEPVNKIVGAQITQYQFKVASGVRMATIQKHQADIERTLAVKGDVRILTPIPGTEYIGVEVENKQKTIAKYTKDHLSMGTLELPLGLEVDGELTQVDLREMPHLLIAGATGSGKSVMLNTVIKALTEQMKPEDMTLILVDPKRVELNVFARKPHLDGPVIHEPKEAITRLQKLVVEMERRYKILQKAEKRDLAEYNESRRTENTKLPYIVIIVDEFADLMLQSRNKGRGGDVESLVVRIAQLGRAAGIHAIVATQRPSVDVITGLIKANFPTRIAFRTSHSIDSKIIIDEAGAEKLTGKGDMIFIGPMIPGGKRRLQGLLS